MESYSEPAALWCIMRWRCGLIGNQVFLWQVGLPFWYCYSLVWMIISLFTFCDLKLGHLECCCDDHLIDVKGFSPFRMLLKRCPRIVELVTKILSTRILYLINFYVCLYCRLQCIWAWQNPTRDPLPKINIFTKIFRALKIHIEIIK